MNKTKKVDQQFEAASSKWVDLVYASLALSFKRYWGWGSKRIQNVINETYDAWDECAEYGTTKSMIQMLDEETGIEIRCYDDPRSYKAVAFLYEPANTYKTLNDSQYIYMRLTQIKWLRAQVTACVLLGLNRRYGFGHDRIVRLLEQMDQIINEYECNPKLLLKVAEEEANFVMTRRDK